MILTFQKPKKLRSTEEHSARYASECFVPGTYVPNMSRADNQAWKGKLVGKRVEIRKSVSGGGVQALVVVCADSVTFSANGRATFSIDQFEELTQAIEEAQKIVAALGAGGPAAKAVKEAAKRGDHPLTVL